MIPPLLLSKSNASLEALEVLPGMKIDGLPPSVLPLVLSYLHSTTRKPILVAFINDEDALLVRDVLGGANSESLIPFYPSTQGDRDKIPGFHSPLESLRFGALESLLSGNGSLRLKRSWQTRNLWRRLPV